MSDCVDHCIHVDLPGDVNMIGTACRIGSKLGDKQEMPRRHLRLSYLCPDAGKPWQSVITGDRILGLSHSKLEELRLNTNQVLCTIVHTTIRVLPWFNATWSPNSELVVQLLVLLSLVIPCSCAIESGMVLSYTSYPDCTCHIRSDLFLTMASSLVIGHWHGCVQTRVLNVLSSFRLRIRMLVLSDREGCSPTASLATTERISNEAWFLYWDVSTWSCIKSGELLTPHVLTGAWGILRKQPTDICMFELKIRERTVEFDWNLHTYVESYCIYEVPSSEKLIYGQAQKVCRVRWLDEMSGPQLRYIL